MALIKGIRVLLRSLEAHVIASSEIFKGTKSRIRELVRELKEAKNYILSTQQEHLKEFQSVYGGKSYALDYIIFLHISLYLLCAEKFSSNESSQNATAKDQVSMKMHYITLMLVHLINSLLSVRLLIEKGLDVQAKQILRSYIEYSDLALAVLGDETFYDNYRRMGEGEKEAREIWNKFTRPSALAKILERIYTDMDGSRELWNLVQSIRKPIYGRLSDYTHGHFMAVFVGALDEKVQGGVAPVPFGAVTKGIDDTLKHGIVYGYSFLKHAIIAIVKYQKLPFIEFGEQGEKFVVHYKMLELYMPALLRSWVDMEGSEAG